VTKHLNCLGQRCFWAVWDYRTFPSSEQQNTMHSWTRFQNTLL